MLPTTLEAIKAVLRADPSVREPERKRLLALLRKPADAKEPEQPRAQITPRIVKRSEAAQLLGNCSLRMVDRLAQSGTLKKVKLPGRTRACGFLEEDLRALMKG